MSDAPGTGPPPLPRMTSREVGAVLISAIVTVAFVGVTILIFFRAIPEASRDVANMLFGSLANMQGIVVAYWVGSSAGSALKDRKP